MHRMKNIIIDARVWRAALGHGAVRRMGIYGEYSKVKRLFRTGGQLIKLAFGQLQQGVIIKPPVIQIARVFHEWPQFFQTEHFFITVC